MISTISIYSSLICDQGGFSNRVKRPIVESSLSSVLKQLSKEDKLSAYEWCGLDAVWYGIRWYVKTGRASVEIEKELNSLNGSQLIRLIVKIWLDGVDVSGNVGEWLRKWQGSYKLKIK